MRKWIRRFLFLVVGLFLLIQLVRPERTNPTSNPNDHIAARLPVHPEVAATFSRSCNDCHSNKTAWPWYSNVAPASWLVITDVNEGRDEMNLSEWGSYNAEKQQELLKGMCKEVTEGEMPGAFYSFAHPRARLSDSDRQAICSWSKTVAGILPGETEHEGD
ncbi:MAG TPA: heme-binding domain-containing protein [Candidatus Angelobacter sp.]|nr:heme-binding domain-containing protein [Candidatus Angelobacter sp.]